MASNMERFKATLNRELPIDIPTARLLEISKKLTESYHNGLHTSTAAMLPSHIYHLPTGYEKGYYLSVDLGGSTLRVALVHLAGHKDSIRRGSVVSAEHPRPMSIVEMKSWGGADVDELKTLKGDAFFDWIATRVGEVVASKFGQNTIEELPMGLSWSFPIESTSINTGKVQSMGKGFLVAETLLGTDLNAHFTNAFARQNLKITLEAIINDSLAAMLSHAYVAPATRCALILGTGTNAAVSLPLAMLPDSKLVPSHSNRPADAQEVLLNTELSMFGKGIYPVTQWDDALDAAMPRPGFQPLEYLIGGAYLGEIGRRIIIDAARSEGLFQNMPELWKKPYSLPTQLLATMEIWPEHKPPTSYSKIHTSLPDQPIAAEDAQALIHISQHISSRAANYCAIALHAMIKLREQVAPSPSADAKQQIIPIAFVGTVMEKYPRLLERTQGALDRLTNWSPGASHHQRMLLEFSPESAIFGAAVAVAAACEKSAPTFSGNLAAPVSLPNTERSSNASTLLQTSSGMEEEKKSISRSEDSTAMKQMDNFSFGEAHHNEADEEPGPLQQRRRPGLWSRFTAFVRGFFQKMLKKT